MYRIAIVVARAAARQGMAVGRMQGAAAAAPILRSAALVAPRNRTHSLHSPSALSLGWGSLCRLPCLGRAQKQQQIQQLQQQVRGYVDGEKRWDKDADVQPAGGGGGGFGAGGVVQHTDPMHPHGLSVSVFNGNTDLALRKLRRKVLIEGTMKKFKKLKVSKPASKVFPWARGCKEKLLRQHGKRRIKYMGAPSWVSSCQWSDPVGAWRSICSSAPLCCPPHGNQNFEWRAAASGLNPLAASRPFFIGV